MSKIDEYNVIKDIKCGEFIDILLVEKDTTQYAMKKVKGRQEIERHSIEIEIILQPNNEAPRNILRFYEHFDDENILYLIHEFVPHGDLSSMIKKLIHFKEETTKFYAMQTILAIEYLHSKDVVHRDIKPENMLIADNGYLKLGDFGFSKVIPRDARTYSFCGTTEYLAPEIIKGRNHWFKKYKGYDRNVDWWTMGVLILDMLSGHTPFKGDNDEDTKNRIKHRIYKLPGEYSEFLPSLIKGFFKKSPCKRWCCDTDGERNVKIQQWFNNDNRYSWEGIRSQGECAPREILDKLESM